MALIWTVEGRESSILLVIVAWSERSCAGTRHSASSEGVGEASHGVALASGGS